MNRFRNSALTTVLGLLMASVVLTQLVSPAAERMRVTTFAQWIDRSLPMDLRESRNGSWDNPGNRSVEQLQNWLLGSKIDEEIVNGEPTSIPDPSWPASSWILQAWNDYNEMTDGMKATLSDRLAASSPWILQKALSAVSTRTTTAVDARCGNRYNLAAPHLLFSLLRQPFLSGVSINAP